MMQLVTVDDSQIEPILDETYPIWGEGLTRHAYSAWYRAQRLTEWGARRLSRVALVDGGRVLASAKRYDLRARLGGVPIDVLGVGAVFTAPELRGHGYAAALLEAMHEDARARGCAIALLFSEIGPDYYERLGYQVVAEREFTIEVKRKPGAPATLVRAGETSDLGIIAEIAERHTEGAAFALERSPDLIAINIARRRLLAGLGPAGARECEFFVSEEGMRAVAYVVISHGPRGRVLEDCGDRDPSGARIGATLQVLDARDPSQPALTLSARLPDALRPPQLIVTNERAPADIMMIRPLRDDVILPAPMSPVVYWNLDLF
jgi:predicted N-acetyltransferase YhbS